MARSQTERVFQHINCNRSKLFCPLKWVLWSRFWSYFEAYGTNCFNVPCKTLLPSKIHHQKHFLIAKTAAKITEQVCQWSQCRPHQQIYRNIHGPSEFAGHYNPCAVRVMNLKTIASWGITLYSYASLFRNFFLHCCWFVPEHDYALYILYTRPVACRPVYG